MKTLLTSSLHLVARSLLCMNKPMFLRSIGTHQRSGQSAETRKRNDVLTCMCACVCACVCARKCEGANVQVNNCDCQIDKVNSPCVSHTLTFDTVQNSVIFTRGFTVQWSNFQGILATAPYNC